MSTDIIESKKYIPWVLRQSRDVQALCKVLDLLINDFKLNVDYWSSLLDVDTCPDRLLPLLSSYLGYKYDYSESYDTNRLIMKHYPQMIRYRGSEIGMSLATALSVNALGSLDKIKNALDMFRFRYVKGDHKLYVYIYFPANLSKIRDLIEVVRPAGCGIQLVAAQIIDTVDGIEISDYIDPEQYDYDFTRYTVGKDDKVGFSEVTNKSEVDRTHNKIRPENEHLGGK